MDVGAHLYNEATLVTPVSTARLRAARQFQSGRKLCKVHQNVLVFFKGDPKTIRDTYGEVEMGDIEDDDAIEP